MNIILEGAQFGGVSIEKKNNDTITFITCLQSADTPNRNGRIYPKHVLEKALKAPSIQEKLATKTWYGEAGHPLDSSVQRQMSIDMRNIAFLIEEIWWEGNLLKGRCTTAATACGRDMKGLIEQGCKVAFSLRAQGNVHTNPVSGLVEVEEGLQILCYDFVAVPSHAQAFMEKICEATVISMYGSTKSKLSSQILCESEDLFMNGKLLNIEPSKETVHMDYTKNYTDKFKKADEMYVPEEGDEVKFMGLKETVISNSEKNVSKKVLTEDFIVKDIRGKLSAMFEAPISIETGKYIDPKKVTEKSKEDENGNYVGRYTTQKKSERVVGNVNRDKDAMISYYLADDKEGREKVYSKVKNNLKEAPTGVESGDYIPEKNVFKVSKTAGGEYIGVRLQHGKKAEPVIGHENDEEDRSMHRQLRNEPSARLKKSIEINDRATDQGRNNW